MGLFPDVPPLVVEHLVADFLPFVVLTLIGIVVGIGLLIARWRHGGKHG